MDTVVLWAFLFACAFALAACGGGDLEEQCAEGRSLACSCPDGKSGAQVCQDDGTWSACSCELSEADAGSNNGNNPSGDTGLDGDDVGDDPSDTGGDGSDTGADDDRGWHTPYPDPPSDAKFVTPDDMRSVLGTLEPGDTMVLRDGTYPFIKLSDVHGTADEPITIMAENERRATVRGDGHEAALRIANSSYIHIKGIDFTNIDKEGSNSETFGAMAIYLTRSDHILLWRNIARNPNPWGNNTCVKLGSGTSNSVLIENEVLDFHRNGIAFHNGEDKTGTHSNIMRRNYINPRDKRWKGSRWGPNYGIAMYRGVEGIVENNILEYSMDNGEENRQVQNCGPDNEFYGNITINGKHGYSHFYYDTPMSGGVLENNLIIGPKQNGFYTRSVDGFVARNNTIVNPGDDGITMYDRDDKSPSFTGYNNLVIGSNDHGYSVPSPGSFSSIILEYSSGWDNGDGTWGPGTDSRENVVSDQDPGLDGTYYHVPEHSPYSGAGKDGADVGANILYRYKDGELTDKPLWNPETGEFPHGAIVEGVNDRPGHSAFDVHERLNVSPETLPDDY